MQVGNLGLLIVAFLLGAWMVAKPAMKEHAHNTEADVMIGVDRSGSNTYDATIPEDDKWLYGHGEMQMPHGALPEETCFAAVTFFFRRKDYVADFELTSDSIFIHYDNLPSYRCDLSGAQRTVFEVETGKSLTMAYRKSAIWGSQVIIDGKKRNFSHVWTKFSPNGRTYRGVLSETPEGMQRMATLFEQ